MCFFDYMSSSPIPGYKNVSYIRDIPSIQMEFHGRSKSEINKAFIVNKNKVSKLDGFVTMTVPLAEHIKKIYGLDKPYVLFQNYPSWKETPTVKRDEFVYIGGIPMKYDKHLEFLSSLEKSSGIKSLFVKRERHIVLNYDFGSKYGLLMNVIDFNQAEESLTRKLLLYLMCGMNPVIHESFSESIKYCRNNGVEPLVYRDVDDISSQIPEHKFGEIDRHLFSMEVRVKYLRKSLEELRGRL